MSLPSGSARTAASRTDDIIKMLISTDNHLGYLETDPVRCDDSFRAFEEVLEIAKANRVDMLVLAGDLFHLNKPSRQTLITTMRLLRKHCLSADGEIHLAVRSDPRAVNYMDPCVAVSLPVFVIHGNHDDPTGGSGSNALSALDLLSQAGLVTYFGRAASETRIKVSPVLLQKGATLLALYGLGNIRDEKLYDTWARQKRVTWLSPSQPVRSSYQERRARSESQEQDEDEEEHSDDVDVEKEEMVPWFNLFVLHQNRVTRGSSKAISDTLLPEWLDYVVWGHEHDSLPDPTSSQPAIVQPGSTVATSLTAGEAKQKHAILLEVYKGTCKHRSVPLQTVRNFEFGDLILSQQPDLSNSDPDALHEFLEKRVMDMVEEQEALYDKKLSALITGSSKEFLRGVRYPSRAFYAEKLKEHVRQPLIRLRVEISGGWDLPLPQRFGRAYAGRVACPESILFPYKRRVTTKTSRSFLQGHGAGLDPDVNGNADDIHFSQGDEPEITVRIPDLVHCFLCGGESGKNGLKFLEVDRFSKAVEEFVVKDEKNAISTHVSEFLKAQQHKAMKEAQTEGKVLDEKELLEKFKSGATAAANRVFAETTDRTPATVENPRSSQDINRDDRDVDVMVEKDQATASIHPRLAQVQAMLTNNPKIAARAAANKAAVERAANQDQSDEDDIKAAPSTKKNPRTLARKSRNSARMPSARRAAARKSSRNTESKMIDDSDDDAVRAAPTPNDEVIEESEEDYVPVSTSTKRRARGSLPNSRNASRGRVSPSPAPSQGRRSVFADRARLRRNTATIDLDEESGDDAM